MYYYLIVALQGFCIYHLWKNRNNYYWVFLILFIPVIGCLIYLFTQVFNRKDVAHIQNELITVINPTKKVRDLEKKLQFTDTFQNRVNLADGYFEIKDYNNAIIHYKESMLDHVQDDYYVCERLIAAFYEIEEYQNVISYAKKIKSNSGFNGSRTQFLFGLALDKVGKVDDAEAQLLPIDQRYSFYEERLLLAEFLLDHNKLEKAKSILNEIYIESQHMTTQNRRKYKATIAAVEKLINEL